MNEGSRREGWDAVYVCTYVKQQLMLDLHTIHKEGRGRKVKRFWGLISIEMKSTKVQTLSELHMRRTANGWARL